MKNYTKLLFALCLMPLMASAQFEFQGSFPDTSMYKGFADVHGLAVDAAGKVYVQPYYPTFYIDVTLKDMSGADSVVSKSAGAIYVFNADGTPNDTIAYAPSLGDTLGGAITGPNKWEYNSGRGMRFNKVNGFLYAAFFNILYKINTETHEVVAKTIPSDGNSTGAPAFDGEGNVYIGPVVGANAPIRKLDADLNYVEDVGAPGGSFSRSMEVAEDGTVYWAGYTNGYVLKYTKPDVFSPYGETPDTVLRGIKSESFAFHPTTGYLWLSAGSPNDLPGESPTTGYAYNMNTWYAFDTAALGTANELPIDSLSWTVVEGDIDVDGRARAMAWTADGKKVYISQFSQSIPSIQVLTGESRTVSIEDGSQIAAEYVLKSNYPNPFNPTTNIEFVMAKSGAVSLNVFDLLGRNVATLVNKPMSAGNHMVTFDASNLSSGTYLYVLSVNGVRLTNKMTLIK
jgi:hypothetical protein